MMRFWLCLFLAGLSIPPLTAAPPNVLLIITDDQGYGDLACHGNPHLHTPHLDRLAAESVRFDRFFVSPLCAPTRASLLTGRYSLRTGTHGVAAGTETMRTEEVTLGELFRSHGYRTGLFGKWHNGEYYPFDPRGQGFDTHIGYNLGHWNNYFNSILKHNGSWKRSPGYITDVVCNAAIDFVKAHAASPFFCYLSIPTPHSPFQVPDAEFDKYQKLGLDNRLACIYGMCENIDTNVGRVLKSLDDHKLRDNTIVIFLTDNGPNGARFNANMKGTKGTLHEGGSRVPFFLRAPGLSPKLVKPIAAHIDVLPTLVELCGLAPTKTLPLDGRSLVPLLKGDQHGSANWPSRTLFTQHVLPPKGQAARGAVRTETHRLVNQTGTKWELYDMIADPDQTRDLARQQPELVTQLRTAFEAWSADVSRGAEGFKPPIPIGHTAENPVELPAPHAVFSGGVKFNGKHPNNAWLVGWDSPAANAEWSLHAVQAGQYRVSVDYLCPAANAGSTLKMVVGTTTLEAAIRATPVVQVPSPDRVPREEVYEMEWTTLPVGTVTLPEGPVKLQISPRRVANGSAWELKLVRLERLGDR